MLQRLLRENKRLFREQHPPAGGGGLRPDYSRGDAKSIILWNHHFESWQKFADHLKALRQKNSPVAQFEAAVRSEEHTSELQSLTNLVCRLLLEKKKTYNHT